MAKKVVSHRLDEELISRADAYAKRRGSTRSVLIEEGLRSLLEDAERAVPDLPEPTPSGQAYLATQGMSPASVRIAREMGWMK